MKVILAEPRGFCAGVDRAIAIVEEALKRFGAPVYVRHEIVHNKYVVDDLKAKGAVFVDDIADIPEGANTVFSAHGVSDKVEEEAKERHLPVIDATCPLVIKVHNQARRFEKGEREIILIGHEGHPEVEGTAGRVKQKVHLVGTPEEAAVLEVNDPEVLSYVTQTTLSVDDTQAVIDVLEERFPKIEGPKTEDICYATQNRQNAVREIAPQVDLFLVVGAANSSNSNRLRDLSEELGTKAHLIATADDIQPQWLENVDKVGLTAGASAPEILVSQVIDALKSHDASLEVEHQVIISEDITFRLPRELRKAG